MAARSSTTSFIQHLDHLPQHGLLRSSFVPERPQHELRDLTRHRAQLQGERSRVANRIHKLLEDANIKLGSVASDILGVSAREMLQHLAGGRGRKRALIAVGHTLLNIIYHVIQYRCDYQDLGADYFLRLEPERIKRYLVKRLEKLGYDVEIHPRHAA